MQSYDTHNLDDLAKVVKELSNNLTPSTRIGLIGSLGAGKTTFTQLLGKELGAVSQIESPTFTFRQTHQLSHPLFDQLVHVDLYRLAQNDQPSYEELGLVDDWHDPRTLLVVEWPDRLPSHIDDYTDLLSFEWLPKSNTRSIQWKKQAGQ